MITQIIFTDFVNQLAHQAQQREIKVVEEFHYIIGSYLKIETEQAILTQFLEDFGFLIEEHRQIKKAP